MRRVVHLTALDTVMLGSYIGMTTWGVFAQLEPPITLTGAAGPVLARVVTLAILAFSVASAVALLFDKADSISARSDVELPALVGLIGAWGTYSATAWLLVFGFGPVGSVPVLKVFAVLTTVMLVPFVVRFVVLLADAIRTLKLARRAQEVGLVDEKWNTLR
jgi:hypothetical protein